MLSRIKFIILFILLIVPSFAFAQRQDIAEWDVRKTRFGDCTQYTGEASPNYQWQPETFRWVDTTTSHECMRMAFKIANESITSKEYNSVGNWNYDGSLLGFTSYVTGTQRTSSDPNITGSTDSKWIMTTKGTKLRCADIVAQDNYPSHNGGWTWLNTENAMMGYGDKPAYDNKGDCLYKCTPDSENDFTCVEVLDLNNGGDLEPIKGSISADDSSTVFVDLNTTACADCPNSSASCSHVYVVQLDGSPAIDNSWGIARQWGPVADPFNCYSNAAGSEETIHGGSYHVTAFHNYITLQYSGNTSVFWIAKVDGNYADGGPDYEDWDGDSYGAGDLLHASENLANGSCTPHNDEYLGYMSHPSFDRWETHVLVGSNHDCGHGCIWGDNCCHGTLLLRLDTFGNPSWYDANNDNYPIQYQQYDGQHHSWTGWTDYVTGVSIANTDLILMNEYTKTTNSGKDNYQAAYSIVDTERPVSPPSNYEANAMPIQSPDGTKVAFHTCLFHAIYASPDDTYQSVAYVVAYYPYPPEITACTASSGTVTTTFEWMLDSTPRGYTQRGWPDESLNDPPPPRETEFFRLWRSSDKSTWTPVDTVDANIHTRFDFSDGTWDGNDYWQISDTPGDGTWYYTVTSVENSGLESHSVGNIFSITVSGGSGTGSEDTSYTSNPGDLDNISASDIKTSFSNTDPSIIVGYNIYAADGSSPSVQQADLVASISKDYCSGGDCYWVDYLGDDGETTQYVVAAYDTQGNISNSTYVTNQSSTSCESGDCSAVSPTPSSERQYLIEWDDMYEDYGAGDSVPPALQAIALGTNGRILALVYSENVSQGSGYNDSDIDIDAFATGNNIGVTYSSGNGTSVHLYTTDLVIQNDSIDVTVTLDFNGDANSLEDDSGNDLAAISGDSVTNNSAQTITMQMKGCAGKGISF